jgi:hypothetical protein
MSEGRPRRPNSQLVAFIPEAFGRHLQPMLGLCQGRSSSPRLHLHRMDQTH